MLRQIISNHPILRRLKRYRKQRPRKSFPPNPWKYLTGNEFKSLCAFSYDEYGFNQNPNGRAGHYFVKTDFLDDFFKNHTPDTCHTLISHNSDHVVGDTYLKQLDLPQLKRWYAQNADVSHPKLHSIPIGLCNFADFSLFHKEQARPVKKDQLVYANYSIETNPVERQRCMTETGMIPSGPISQGDYLHEVHRSLFVISPNGNGIDCHRTWEALYLSSIPIVTRSTNSDFYRDFPIIFLNSWKEFRQLPLGPDLYHRQWNNFNPERLKADRF
jgi:hypothetical protein